MKAMRTLMVRAVLLGATIVGSGIFAAAVHKGFRPK